MKYKDYFLDLLILYQYSINFSHDIYFINTYKYLTIGIIVFEFNKDNYHNFNTRCASNSSLVNKKLRFCPLTFVF